MSDNIQLCLPFKKKVQKKMIFATLSSEMPVQTGKFQMTNVGEFKRLSNETQTNPSSRRLYKKCILETHLGETELRKGGIDE